MALRCPVCRTAVTVGAATHDEPNHFTFSGIPNLWLIGTPRYRCAPCDADQLWFAGNGTLTVSIGQAIAARAPSLSRDEVRYLRKFNRSAAQRCRPTIAVDWRAILRTPRVAAAAPIVLEYRPKLRSWSQIDAAGINVD